MITPMPSSSTVAVLLVLSLCFGAVSVAPSTARAQVVIRQIAPSPSPPRRAYSSYSSEATEPPPYQAPRERGSHPLWGLFVPAFILFGVTYLSTIGVTAGLGSRGSDIGISAIPWAGPWVCLSSCQRPGPFTWALILSGTVQAVTTILWIIGAAVQVGDGGDEALLEHEGVRFTPWASADGAGLVLDVEL